MSNLFSKFKGQVAGQTQLDTIVNAVKNQLNRQGAAFAEPTLAKSVISMESLSGSAQQELSASISELNSALEHIASTAEVSGITSAQIDAGVVAGILASNPRAHLTQAVKQDQISTESDKFISMAPGAQGDAFDSRMKAALESYDESENRNVASYSVAYNMQAAAQDEFGEMFFPTTVVTPNQAGLSVSIRITSVYNEIRRAISGAVTNFNRRNIIEAAIDPEVLRNDQTNVVPVYRDESKEYFVPATVLVPYDTLVGTEVVTTSALAMGKKLSLSGISQTETLLETGILDASDSLDQAIKLSTVVMQVPGAAADGSDDEVFKFNVGRLPYANFMPAQQGHYRGANLNFNTSDLRLDKTTKQADGAATALLNAIVVGEYTFRLAVGVSGSVNLDLGDTSLYASQIEVVSIRTKDGVAVAKTDAAVAAVVAKIESAKLVGYELEARFSNLNRRQRGQLLDSTNYGQTYQVPLRAPISIPRPLTNADETDSSDLASLITATRIRASNAAVEEILRVADVLKDYIGTADPVGDTPEILGTARYLVKPFFEKHVLDVEAELDSLTSTARAEDIQSLLVNKVRDIAYRMYRDSGYKPAADALAGGQAPLPLVLMGTDTVLAGYLNVTGDLRTLGGNFQHKIATTTNKNMSGKIVMTLGQQGVQDGVPNPLHFGNMAWKSELVTVLPLHRNGQTSKELTVQPAFLHVTHLPVLAIIEVKGIDAVVASKVKIATM